MTIISEPEKAIDRSVGDVMATEVAGDDGGGAATHFLFRSHPHDDDNSHTLSVSSTSSA